jgi:hypothetical protein
MKNNIQTNTYNPKLDGILFLMLHDIIRRPRTRILILEKVDRTKCKFNLTHWIPTLKE